MVESESKSLDVIDLSVFDLECSTLFRETYRTPYPKKKVLDEYSHETGSSLKFDNSIVCKLGTKQMCVNQQQCQQICITKLEADCVALIFRVDKPISPISVITVLVKNSASSSLFAPPRSARELDLSDHRQWTLSAHKLNEERCISARIHLFATPFKVDPPSGRYRGFRVQNSGNGARNYIFSDSTRRCARNVQAGGNDTFPEAPRLNILLYWAQNLGLITGVRWSLWGAPANASSLLALSLFVLVGKLIGAN